MTGYRSRPVATTHGNLVVTNAGKCDVQLVVPVEHAYLRMIRLVASDVAARAGLDCFEVEDFRIVVDELSCAAMSVADRQLRLAFRAGDRVATARGSARSRAGTKTATLSALSEVLVAGACDRFEFRLRHSQVSFLLEKRSDVLRSRAP